MVLVMNLLTIIICILINIYFLLKDREDNYKPIPIEEQVDFSYKDYI